MAGDAVPPTLRDVRAQGLEGGVRATAHAEVYVRDEMAQLPARELWVTDHEVVVPFDATAAVVAHATGDVVTAGGVEAQLIGVH